LESYSITKTPLQVLLLIAERLRKLRKEAKYSQAELALRTGVSLGSLKRFETTGHISLDSLIKLANILGRMEDFESLFIIDEDLKRIEKLFSK
jgi:transcriptional regulator with XRE-family HTH domain